MQALEAHREESFDGPSGDSSESSLNIVRMKPGTMRRGKYFLSP
jgi:hypothetical protein